jgi:hypothetical protein
MTISYQNPIYYDSTHKAYKQLQASDNNALSSSIVPISATNGNQLQALTDGLYDGIPAFVYYVNSSGTDDTSHGTKAAPFKTLDYALNYINTVTNNGAYPRISTIALAAGQTFPLTTTFNLNQGLILTFYGDPNYGDFDGPVIGSGALPETMSDLQRPIITPTISSTSPWQLAHINRQGGSLYLRGIQVNLPGAPTPPSINLYTDNSDFIKNTDYSSPGQILMSGSIINMTDINAYWGFMGINSNSCNTQLIQYASQFQIGGVPMDSSHNPTPAQLLARQYFIKFYLGPAGNNQNQVFLSTTSLNSTTASGTLTVTWADTEALTVMSGKTNLASFPLCSDVTYGLRHYIFNLNMDQQQRPLNFLSSRII